ncbi:MAG: type VI secretion system baseplate subunit TssE [Planctomycetota bacterium]
MADLTPTDRLQPCLLDRLTDDERSSTRESRDRRVFGLRQVREAVLRDLSWLLNTATRFTPDDMPDAPNVVDSVINYGVRDLTGMTASGLELQDLERTIRAALLRFEPRVMPGSLRVVATSDPNRAGNTLAIEIAGDLWAQPVPEPLYVRTELDLETGGCRVEEGRPT